MNPRTVLMLACLLALLLPSSFLHGQTRDQMRSQAESQLQSMTPEEIEAKIREYGMTRAEAEARASELGIDLKTFLQQRGRSSSQQAGRPAAVRDSAMFDTTRSPYQPATPSDYAPSPYATPSQEIPSQYPSQTVSPETPQQVPLNGQQVPAVEAPQTVPGAPAAGAAQQRVQPGQAAGRAPAVPQYQAPKQVVVPRGAGGLPYFGYDAFSQPSSAFEPTASGPVDPEYLIGSDDVLRITVWGQVELQHEVTVDKEGRIFIPTIGQFLVSGLTLAQATDRIKKQMSRSYSGLLSQPPTIQLDVSMARLRPKRVFLMGDVARPGGYTVSSYATVFSALYSVGGPTVKGSLRDVRVVRDGKTVAHVDLYDYLTGAEQTNDLRVQNNDIVFVPPRGRTVGINREVRKPALYELKEGEELKALLGFAGGALSTAYLERVLVDRIVPFPERKPGELERRVVDVDFRQLVNNGRDFVLADGDMISVYSVLDRRDNVVRISGAVWRPGAYQLEQARTVRHLVALAQGPLQKAYLGEAHLIRYNADEITRALITLDIGAILADSTRDVVLAKRDEVVIFSTEATEFKTKYVTIRGQVKQPGRVALFDNMTLRDLVLAAGGYTDDAEVLEAEVARVRRSGLGGDSLAILLHPALPAKFASVSAPGGVEARVADFPLEHRDEVMIRPNPRFRTQQNVSVSGDILYPGTYALRERGETLSQILHRAGGPTTTSYFEGGQFFRGGKRVAVDFRKAYEGEESQDVVMLEGDNVIIPSRPHTVFVTGEVNRPGLISFIQGDAVSDYIDRAGGRTDSASYAVLSKPSGESRKVEFGLFRSNPNVPEGSTIEVFKIQPEPEGKPVDVGGTIKDIFAIVTSAATLVFLAIQATK